jgi:MFS family permease
MALMAPETRESLWHDRAFLKLWAGQSISQLGSQVSFLTLPLIAALMLDATAFEMGVLTAMSSLPALLIGLYAGAIVDRRARQPVLIATDISRACLLTLIPMAWYFDVMTISMLMVVAFAIGICGLFFDLAYQAFLPIVVHHDHLIEGNAKLELSRTAGEIAGPGLAGLLLQLVTAPIALLVDAVSYLSSGLLISSIRTSEPQAARSSQKQHMRQDIREGLSLVMRGGILRTSAAGTIALAFFNAMLEAVFVLYAVRVLGLSPALLGIIFGVGSFGFLVGTALPDRLIQRFGFGAVTGIGLMLIAGSDLLVPLAGDSRWIAVPLLMAAQFVFGIGITLFRVNQSSLRQAVVADEFRGRVASVIHVFAGGAVLLGALIGGGMGEAIGLRETLVLSAVGELIVAMWVLLSPLRSLRMLPQPAA